MVILERILTTLQIIMAVIVMILVLLQSDNESGSIITSSEKSSMGLSKDARLARMTAIMGTAFIVLTIASGALMLINNL
jgi:protein translocase SecG subunit